MAFDNSKIENIRNNTNIVNVLSEYIDIQKRGRNYWAVCPFHNDSNPSMSISEDKQIYKCFVCGAGGNVFSFVQNFENIPFMEAVKKVGQDAGIDVSDIKTYVKKDKVKDENPKLFAINKDASNFFNMNLKSENGLEAMKYLESRGIDKEVINKFSIGLAPAKDELTKFLVAKGYSEVDIINAGVGRTYSNAIKDSFNDRIMFTIKSYNGDPIGFSGRTYKESTEPKYINTAETHIFNKGATLYNYSDAANFAKKEKKVIIVEGFMDVIALDKAKIHNVVATMGTAFTDDHISKLRNLSKTIILFMDGDSAGIKATISMAQKLLTAKMEVTVVKNQTGMDADEILEEKGAAELAVMIKRSKTLIEFMLDTYISKVDKNSPDEISKFIAFIKKYLVFETDSVRLKVLASKIADALGVDASIILDEVNVEMDKKVEKEIKQIDFKKDVEVKKVLNKYQVAERNLLWQMLNNKVAAELYEIKLGYMHNMENKIIANYIVELYKDRNEINAADLISMIKSNDITEIVTDIDFSDLNPKFNKIEFEENMDIVRSRNAANEIDELNEKMHNEKDPIKQAELAQQIIQLKIKGGK